MAFETVFKLDDLWDGEKRSIKVRDRQVLFVRLGDAIFACEDRCPHQGVPLSEGEFNGCALTCSAHGWVFDMSSGKGINPADAVLTSFSTKVDEEYVLVDLGDE